MGQEKVLEKIKMENSWLRAIYLVREGSYDDIKNEILGIKKDLKISNLS